MGQADTDLQPASIHIAIVNRSIGFAEPKTKGDCVASELQDRHDVLMASDLSAGYGITEPADLLHGLAAFLLFGIVQRHFDTITGLQPQQEKAGDELTVE